MRHLKAFSPALLLAGSLVVSSATVFAGKQNLDLEPCINGGVSASGSFETQALEDAAMRHKRQVASIDVDVASGVDDVISAFGGRRDDFLR